MELDNAGGINGTPVTLLVEDDAGTSAGAVTAANKLIDVDHVNALVGPLFTSNIIAVKPVATEAEVPVMIATSADEHIFAQDGYVFSIDAANEVSIKLLSQYLYYEKGFRNLSILGNYNDQTLSMIDYFNSFWSGYGGTVVSSATFLSGSDDFRTELTKINDAQPDVVWISADTQEFQTIIRQMAELGMDNVFLATDYQAIQADFFEAVGAYVDGRLCYTQNGVASDIPTQEKYDAFITGYSDMFGEEPEAFVSLLYDCFELLFTGLENSATYKGADIRASIAGIEDFIGVSGHITFDDWGRSQGSSTILSYENGLTAVVDYSLTD